MYVYVLYVCSMYICEYVHMLYICVYIYICCIYVYACAAISLEASTLICIRISRRAHECIYIYTYFFLKLCLRHHIYTHTLVICVVFCISYHICITSVHMTQICYNYYRTGETSPVVFFFLHVGPPAFFPLGPPALMATTWLPSAGGNYMTLLYDVRYICTHQISYGKSVCDACSAHTGTFFIY